MNSSTEQYIIVRHIADGEYRVIGWRTLLSVEFWATLRMVSAADLVELERQGVRVVDAPRAPKK